MSELPGGWKIVSLAEVCEVNPRDSGPADQSRAVSFVPMPAVSDTDGVIMSHEAKPFRDVAKGYTRFRERDVIFAKITPCMENGKSAVATDLHGGVGCGSTEFHVLRSGEAILPEYLWRFLRQKTFRDEAERHMTGAVGQRRVPAQYIKDSNIPLPSVSEQSRIVAKLGTLFDRSKNARDELGHLPRLVQRYREAVLASAFRGDLTADWRSKASTKPKGRLAADLAATRSASFRKAGTNEKPALSASWTPNIELPETWEFVSVDQLTTLVQYGSSAKTSESLTKGVPVLRMGNIFEGQLDYSKLKYLPTSHSEFPDLLLKDGDILFNRTNSAELVGKTAVYTDVGHPTSFASYLIRLRVVGYLPELLSAYINSALGREWVRSVVNQQVGQANVNGTKLRELGVPLMSMDEQRELWSRISRAFTRIDDLSKEATRANELLGRLDQATLARAFRGDLVPQQTVDEHNRLDPPAARSERPQHRRKIGILAFGSLIQDPGPELKPRIVERVKTLTPFPVEYARISGKTRGGAPTLVPHKKGSPVSAELLILDDAIPADEARDMLWRRETRKVGCKKYAAGTSADSVLVRETNGSPCVNTVLYTDFRTAGKIRNPTAKELAKYAIQSVKRADRGRDGISYLINAIAHGIVTPLTPAYKAEILKQAKAKSLEDALRKAREQ